MRSLLTLLASLLSFLQAYPQTDTEKAIKLIENAFSKAESAWNEFKLLKYDQIDTLYILPTESKEYIEANKAFENIKNNVGKDSTNFYIKAKMQAMRDKKEKLYDLYTKKVDEWQAKDGNNILQVMENLGNAVINYTEEQKGWKMRCRILSNGKEENIEVQFNVNLEQITDILPYQYAITYEKLRHMNNSNDFWILKKQFDKRNN